MVTPKVHAARYANQRVSGRRRQPDDEQRRAENGAAGDPTDDRRRFTGLPRELVADVAAEARATRAPRASSQRAHVRDDTPRVLDGELDARTRASARSPDGWSGRCGPAGRRARRSVEQVRRACGAPSSRRRRCSRRRGSPWHGAQNVSKCVRPSSSMRRDQRDGDALGPAIVRDAVEDAAESPIERVDGQRPARGLASPSVGENRIVLVRQTLLLLEHPLQVRVGLTSVCRCGTRPSRERRNDARSRRLTRRLPSATHAECAETRELVGDARRRSSGRRRHAEPEAVDRSRSRSRRPRRPDGDRRGSPREREQRRTP